MGGRSREYPESHQCGNRRDARAQITELLPRAPGRGKCNVSGDGCSACEGGQRDDEVAGTYLGIADAELATAVAVLTGRSSRIEKSSFEKKKQTIFSS